MAISVVRYIELLHIEQHSNTHYLHLIVHLNNATEVYMEIDAFTAENLLALCTFDDGDRYRLSLRALEDVFTNRVYSTITKTKLTRSERLDFDISPIYRKNILDVKNCGSTDQLLALPFIFLPSELPSSEQNVAVTQITDVSELVVSDSEILAEVLDETEPIHTETVSDDEHVTENVIEEAINNKKEVTMIDTEDISFLDEHASTDHSSIEEDILERGTTQELAIDSSPLVELEEQESDYFTDVDETNTKIEELTEDANVSISEEILEKQVEELDAIEQPVLPQADETVEETTVTTKEAKPKKVRKSSFSSPIVLIALLLIIVAAIVLIFKQLPNQDTTNTPEPTPATASVDKEKFSYSLNDTYTFTLPNEYVAITFTKGPSPYTAEIISILEEHNVPATFFLVGKYVSQYPDLVTMLAEHQYSIGHATENYTFLKTMSHEEQNNDILNTAQKIEKLTNKPVTMFRTPYGLFNNDTQTIVTENELKVVNWSIDPYDVKAQSAAEIVAYLEQQGVKGSIINLAESNATVEALPDIIKLLQQQQLKPVMLQ